MKNIKSVPKSCAGCFFQRECKLFALGLNDYNIDCSRKTLRPCEPGDNTISGLEFIPEKRELWSIQLTGFLQEHSS
jgi:hypothetical protein